MSSEKPVSHFLELARGMVPPMHPAGRPFVAGAAIATLLVRLRFKRLGVVLALVTAWVAWFFREPKRVTPTRPNLAVAPADGTVSHVVDAVPPAELGLGSQPMTRVSVFLSVFDVHVQRVPADGEVVQVSYHPGKFLSADLDKASEENERNTVWLRTVDGHDLVVVQIAGLVARRIVCEVAEGEKVTAGQTYGLIRFGSRVDLYVPRGSRVLVEAGQRTIGGETVLAELPEA
ncbi:MULTISPECIES: phosphatidylserine decarboxylase [Lentzea]|jgi:phosphatidylserine decarboxylase|uniref:Phosphatidylserine decarboxylase proenzyme n=4 Tax=Lentzea TaxID=165301 RepID=A0A1H9LNG4_9PSEU|nr:MULTISPECIES: phosphatidylserine decarboxylase [Lentzea]MCG8924317.1 phosphatidylserine decarboxylase [Lentzea sp. CC55]MCR3747567.1 phosphatidylserine decarboxylase [Lentzea californiensis]MCX2953242.1 phosphatidylserine decarboxylase [Lentzea sp. NEAU-D7]MDX8051253.1 phosphatidylserine decarboxylase [Lentzea sp. BCCO 10_0798]RDI31254.1 phosphatidylserine decarboxylase [Lentzea flaviverrucosa]